jgi:hypothetical protein
MSNPSIKKLKASLSAVATTSSSDPPCEPTPELSKADGKRKALDDDEDATATEGEATTAENSTKKRKKQTK